MRDKKSDAEAEAIIWGTAYGLTLFALVLGESIRVSSVNRNIEPAVESLSNNAAKIADVATDRILRKLSEIEGRTKQ